MTSRLTIATVAVAGLAMSLAGVASAESARAKEAPADVQSFMQEAATGGMAEVELGKMAQERASSPDVKQFGKRMVEDHSKVNAELKQLAAKKGVTLPQKMDAEHQAVRDRLAKLSGEAFDRAYMDFMKEDHQHDLAAFREAAGAADPDVKAFASKTVPTLEEHAAEVERVQGKLTSTGAPPDRVSQAGGPR